MLEFICLNPRRKKKEVVNKMLSVAGSVKFLSFAPLALRRYPESRARAREALSSATKMPKSKILLFLKMLLLESQYGGSRVYFERRPSAVAVAWNGLNGTRRVFMSAAKDAGNKTLFFELSPFKDRVTIDPSGVNFANALPRSSKPYIDWASEFRVDIDAWRSISSSVKQRKPNYETANSNVPPLNSPFIFVPLQVPGDSQLRLFGGSYTTVENFVEAILEASQYCPEGWTVRIKEHPSAVPMIQKLIESYQLTNVVIDNVTDTFEQVRLAQLVLTVNSSVGLESMLFGKPVVAAGDCFWAIDGIAASAKNKHELISVFSNPLSVSFNEIARSSFISYLILVYYPSMKDPNRNDIYSRIFGFNDGVL